MLGSVVQGILFVGSVGTAYRLYMTGLYRRYPFFFLYFVIRIPNSIWPLFIDIYSNTYLHLWVITEPIFDVLYVLMVLELYRLVLERYKGLYTVGRWAMYLFATISVAISALTLIPKIRPVTLQKSRILPYVVALDRGICLSLAIFLIFLLIFMTLFRSIKLSRNVRVHAIIYPIFFLSTTMAMLLRSLFGTRLGDQFNIAFSMISAGAVIAWLVLLSPAGEEAPSKVVRLGEDYESRALTHLDALNATMLRVSRQ